MAAFLGLWVDFATRLRKVPEKKQNAMFAGIRQGWRWKGFQPAIFLSMMFIFIRCVYRAIELNEVFEGKLANDEITFMMLEGPMIMIAAALVAVWHPGFAFGGMWAQSAWRWNGKDDGIVPSEKLENDSSSEV